TSLYLSRPPSPPPPPPFPYRALSRSDTARRQRPARGATGDELAGTDILGASPVLQVEVVGRLRDATGRRVDRRAARGQPVQPAGIGHQRWVHDPEPAGRRVATGAGPDDVALPGRPGLLVDLD